MLEDVRAHQEQGEGVPVPAQQRTTPCQCEYFSLTPFFMCTENKEISLKPE